MKRVHKGEFGYISYQRKWTILRTVIYFAICMSIFAAGYITTGSRKNLLTIVAVLGCLPACKSAVNVVMFFRAKGCTDTLHEAIEATTNITTAAGSKLAGLYDLYMTTYKTNYAISHLAIAEKTIVGIVENKDINVNAIETHIQDHLKQDGHKDMTVKIFTDVSKYTDRLNQLARLELEPLKVQDSILEMLLSISL